MMLEVHIIVTYQKSSKFCRKGHWRQFRVFNATSKEISNNGQGLTAVEKIFNKNALEHH